MKEKILAVVRETIETLGYLPVDMKMSSGGKMKKLLVVIYKQNSSISMDDCSRVSNVILRRLEVEIPSFSESYDLTVESPGVDRKLTSIQEVEIFLDRKMRFVLRKIGDYPLQSIELVSKPVRIEGNKIIVDIEGKMIAIDWNDIASLKLYFDIKEYL